VVSSDTTTVVKKYYSIAENVNVIKDYIFEVSFTTVKTFVKWLKLMKLKLGKLKHHKLLVLRVQFQKVIFNSNDMRNYCYPCIFSFVYCTQLFLSL